MKKSPWVTFAFIALITGQALAIEITSLAPVRGTPGTVVGIGGGPFSPQTQPFLGEQYATPRTILKNYMEFTVPFLPPGKYTLTVQDNTVVAAQTYQFEVMAPRPQVTNINPSILDACSSAPLNLQISGRNFLPGAVLLVNDRVIPSRIINSTSIEAQTPELLEPGVYGVSVSNPDGATSLPHSLWVNSTPEIDSVELGDDFVNYYEVIIHGKNFQFNSTLVVKDPEDSALDETYQQLSSVPQKNAMSQVSNSPQGNRLIYVDCQTLIYQRYRTSQAKNLRLQIFNPDGRKTDMYYVDLP